MEKVALYICVKLYGLDAKDIIFKIMENELVHIDGITLRYRNALNYFDNNKRELLRIIRLNSAQYGFIVAPNEIELNTKVDDPMYIIKDHQQIEPLFSYFTSAGKEHSLDERLKLILSYKLKKLYDKDLVTQWKDDSYESIFQDFDSAKRQNLKSWLNSDVIFYPQSLINEVFDEFKRSSRFSAIARYLLYEMWDMPKMEIRRVSSLKKDLRYWSYYD